MQPDRRRCLFDRGGLFVHLSEFPIHSSHRREPADMPSRVGSERFRQNFPAKRRGIDCEMGTTGSAGKTSIMPLPAAGVSEKVSGEANVISCPHCFQGVAFERRRVESQCLVGLQSAKFCRSGTVRGIRTAFKVVSVAKTTAFPAPSPRNL
jgi:hypothetical protein